MFEQARPEVVFHLAAQIDIRVAVGDPALDASINVARHDRGARGRAQGRRPARSSTRSTGGGLYGDAELLPTPETYEIAPMAPYGQSKLSAEGYCGLYTRLHGISSVSLRYGNVYGPRQDVHGEAGVVAIFCGHLIEGKTPTIFGDGHQTRDWVEVSDVVRANLLAADSRSPARSTSATGRRPRCWISCRRSTTSRASRRLQPSSPRRGRARSARSCLDVSRAKRDLGWEPQVQLRDGLRRVLDSL